MSRIKEWFTEFCLVLEITPQLEYWIAAAFALPALIFAFGTWVITSLDTSGPYCQLPYLMRLSPFIDETVEAFLSLGVRFDSD